MNNRDVFILSGLLFLLSSATYMLKLPPWLYPFSIFLFINILGVVSYHKYRTKFLYQSITAKELEAFTQSDVKELDMARRVQESLLSAKSPEHNRFKLVKKCVPATSLGGDFYTFINKSVERLSQSKQSTGVIEFLDSHHSYLGITIGDVAGHGVSSALVMALSSGLFEKIGQVTDSPSKILEKANQDIYNFIHNTQISHVTSFYAVLNLDTLELRFSRAGHHPALLIKRNNHSEELDVPGVFLGLYEEEAFEESSIQLDPGDRVLFYTDGITEPTNKDHEEFGVQRLKNLAIEYRDKPVEELLDSVFNEVQDFTETDEAKDDQTLVILEVN